MYVCMYVCICGHEGNYFKLDEVAYRKDAKGECTEVKFSPSNDMVKW